jgi:hypothetical protein
MFGSHVTALLAAPSPMMPLMYDAAPANLTTIIADMATHAQAVRQTVKQIV